MLGHPLRLVATLLAGLLLAWTLGPVPSAGAAGSGLALNAPPTARIGGTVKVTATLAGDTTRPTGGANVQLQRQDGSGGWTTIAGSVTTDDGVAGFSVVPQAGTQYLRARLGEDVVSTPVALEGVVVGSSLHIFGPASIVDEDTGELLMRWTGSDGLPVTGTVAVYQHARNQSWTRLGTTRTGADGRTRVRIAPRVDMSYQFRGVAGPGWQAATSPGWTVDNKPPLAPVTM